MRIVLAVVLVVLSFAHADEHCTRLESQPVKWHLLSPNSSESNGRSGLLLAELEYGERMWGVIDDRNRNPVYHEICNSEYKVHSSHEYFSEDETMEFPQFRLFDYAAYTCDDASVGLLFLECVDKNNTDPEWDLVGAGLYFLSNETEEIEKGREGLLVVHFADQTEEAGGEGSWLSGTVCDDRFTDHAADLSCQYLGYEYAEEWGSGRQYVPDSILEENMIQILVDDINCDESNTNITECEAAVLEGHDCSRPENLWLKCASNSSEPEWVFDFALLYDVHYEGKLSHEGLLIIGFKDMNHQEVKPKIGTVCDDSFNGHAANLSCQYLGYKYADAWGSNPENAHYFPTEYYEQADLPILVDDVQCDEWTKHISECEARMFEHDCSKSENIWLKCSMEDDEEEGTEEGGTEEGGTEEEGTEEQGLELEFGGAKLSLNLNKIHKKWNF